MAALRQTAIIPEYALKIAAIPGALTAMGADGSIMQKTLQGIVGMPRAVYDACQNISFLTTELPKIAHDYNTLPASQFVNRYGSNATEYMMNGINEAVAWTGSAYSNLSEQPLQTATAALLTAGLFYGVGRAVRFWRQKGRGSFADKLEMKLGKKIWDDEEHPEETA